MIYYWRMVFELYIYVCVCVCAPASVLKLYISQWNKILLIIVVRFPSVTYIYLGNKIIVKTYVSMTFTPVPLGAFFFVGQSITVVPPTLILSVSFPVPLWIKSLLLQSIHESIAVSLLIFIKNSDTYTTNFFYEQCKTQ